MHIREVMVSDCTNIDIIAKDVINYNGVIMLSKGTIVTDYLKKRLIEIGVKSVYVYNPVGGLNNIMKNLSYQNLKQNYRETILLVKNLISDLASGKALQYSKVVSITNIILKSINEKENIINCLNKIGNVDGYTHAHCVNVAFYSMLIGTWLGLSDKEVIDVIQAGLLHDIGKTKIPNDILNKKGALTSEEFNIIKNHTILGYELLNEIDGINQEVKNAVLLHHERIDGSGYPFNASAESVGLYAKIVAIADVFDAMTSDRVYKKKKTPFDAFEMFKSIGVGIFDTNILNIFLKNLSTYYTGTNVILSNGEKGKIVYVPPQDILSPVVEVKSNYLDLSVQNGIKIVSIY